jgi:hypothetical protein
MRMIPRRHAVVVVWVFFCRHSTFISSLKKIRKEKGHSNASTMSQPSWAVFIRRLWLLSQHEPISDVSQD